MSFLLLRLPVIVSLLAITAAGQSHVLTTTFASNNGQSGNMFDVVAYGDVNITCFDLNLDPGTWDVEVWKLPPGQRHASDLTNATGAWSLIAKTEVSSNGINVPTPLPATIAVFIPAGGLQAFYITVTNGTAINYTNGTSPGALYVNDAYLGVLQGVGKSYPFGATNSPRIWNGNIRYSVSHLETPAGLGGTNGQTGAMFDISATGGKPVTILSFEQEFNTGSAGTYTTMAVYCVRGGGSYAGKADDASLWLLLGTALTAMRPQGAGPSNIPIRVGVTIPAGGTCGFYVSSTSNSNIIAYSNGSAEFAPATFNTDITVRQGRGKTYPFGTNFVTRNWNGHVNYVAGYTPGGRVPELLYYRFDESGGTTTANAAVPGVGAASGTVVTHTLGSPGRFGNGLASGGTAGYVNTGWMTSLTSDWTVSCILDLTSTTSTSLAYLFGEATGSAMRAFTQGAAGVDNVILRGSGIVDVIITGGGANGKVHHLTWVHNSAVPEIRGYLDGILSANVAQPALSISGTGGFRVGGQLSGLAVGTVMDEFRLYDRALSATEVREGVNKTLGFCSLPQSVNFFSLTQSGPGVGDLTISLTNIPPTATEGFTLISANVAFPYATGPFLGLHPDFATFWLLSQPYFAGSPIHFSPADPGVYPNVPFFIPPGSTTGVGLTGLTFDYVSLLLRPAGIFDSASNVVRITYQ